MFVRTGVGFRLGLEVELSDRPSMTASLLTPLPQCLIHEDAKWSTVSRNEYLGLVDAGGRIIKSGKRGHIPHHLLPILERLDLDAERWVDFILHGPFGWGSAIGCALARAAEAVRRGVQWICDRCRIHRNGSPTDPAIASV